MGRSLDGIWDKLGLSVGTVMGAHVGYPLGYSINMFLGLALGNLFVTREGSLVGVSLGILVGFMIGTVEGSLVGLSLGITLRSLPIYPNPGANLHVTILGAPLGLWYGSEAVRCWCYYFRLTDFCEDTCAGARAGKGGEGGYVFFASLHMDILSYLK